LALSILLNISLITYIFLAHSPVPSSTPPVATPDTGRPPPHKEAASRSNLIWPSEDFSQSLPENAIVEINASAGPTGTKTATRLVEDLNDGRHRIERSAGGLRPGAVHTFSVFVKAAERTGIMLEIRDDKPGKYGVVRFDVEARSQLAKTG